MGGAVALPLNLRLIVILARRLLVFRATRAAAGALSHGTGAWPSDEASEILE